MSKFIVLAVPKEYYYTEACSLKAAQKKKKKKKKTEIKIEPHQPHTSKETKEETTNKDLN
jgi:hypothetical protein